MENHKFNRYESVYDQDLIMYGLAKDGVEKMIEGVLFYEVTIDFKRVQLIRADSLKVVGTVMKQF
jgi:hypothetical protein